MIPINANVRLKASEIQFTYIRSPGPGGQNVNKVATAVQLRFNVLKATSFNEALRSQLLTALKNKLTLNGDIIIKSSSYRSQAKNKEQAIQRLQKMLKSALFVPKKRKKTKPSQLSKQKRLIKKKQIGAKKNLRRLPPSHE